MPDEHDKPPAIDWWAAEEAFERTIDAARDEQFFSEVDAHIADIHEWLEAKYRRRYKPGQVELCLEAALACQAERVPIPPWLIEALRSEIELALRRPVAWEQLRLAAHEANEERKRIAQKNCEWFWQEGQAILELNPTLGSEERLAQLISRRAKGTEHEAAARTIRRHIRGILARRSKHGQTE